MEDRKLEADQSIELIQRMIRDTRRKLTVGSSNLFLVWGYLLAATAVGIFILLTATGCRAWQWLWLPALAIGWAVTWWYNRRAPQVKSYTDRLLEQIWGCVAVVVLVSTLIICLEFVWPVDPLFPALLLICTGLYISGTVIGNKSIRCISGFLLPISIGIIRNTWFNHPNPDGNLILFAAAVLIGLTGSGYALKRQVKRDAEKASENEQ